MAPPRTSWKAVASMTTPDGLAVTEHVPKGRSDAPRVVLVHGSLDRSASFARVVRRLSDLHTVVYDRRGYHRSRAALPLHAGFEGHVDDLISVIAGRPTVIVGHSYGGDVALAAALRPESGGSVLAVAAYEPPMPWLALYRADPSRRGPPVEADPGDPDAAAAAAEQFFRRMVGDAAWERLSEPARAARRADGPALAAELRAIRLAEAPFDVTALRVPATFGRGERSARRHRQSVAWLLDHTPGAELFEIAGASHGAHLTHPDAFAAMVRSAVARARWPAPATPTGAPSPLSPA
jgi:pimeloyl-ACP methyl ester carboxylesterase